MPSKHSLSVGAIPLMALLVSACGNTTPTGPTPLPDVTPSPAPAPPSPAPAPRVIGTWDLTVHITGTAGKGEQCVLDSLRAEINTHNQYSLSIVETADRTEATLASASGDFECTYPTQVDSTGFTEAPGYYTCAREQRVVSCAGTEHRLMTFGQTITGRFSGNEVTGQWSAFWIDVSDNEDEFDVKTQFTGPKR
jgi:hypothetical protein